jgi:hypothetical protein
MPEVGGVKVAGVSLGYCGYFSGCACAADGIERATVKTLRRANQRII